MSTTSARGTECAGHAIPGRKQIWVFLQCRLGWELAGVCQYVLILGNYKKIKIGHESVERLTYRPDIHFKINYDQEKATLSIVKSSSNTSAGLCALMALSSRSKS